MKSIVKPSFYFSAYPLRAIKDTASSEKQPGSPYLKAVLSGKNKTVAKKARVFSMVNPYRSNFKITPEQTGKLPKDIELTEKDWFKNYE
ncbi:MAG TPA: hypothetical protein VI461_00745 [Chitinophagaceae bacterium]|nr:hypothetical protein [Chitinophagaceae bacterium]